MSSVKTEHLHLAHLSTLQFPSYEVYDCLWYYSIGICVLELLYSCVLLCCTVCLRGSLLGNTGTLSVQHELSCTLVILL